MIIRKLTDPRTLHQGDLNFYHRGCQRCAWERGLWPVQGDWRRPVTGRAGSCWRARLGPPARV